MILVDTSVWVDHLRAGDEQLAALLNAGRVLIHPFVLGELALGRLGHRARLLQALADLPQAVVAADAEVAKFIEDNALHGQGIGYVDAHLLASVRLSAAERLWTRDRRLADLAARLGA